jgi:acetyltransferase-like isoleucine patch superfamily enzyme
MLGNSLRRKIAAWLLPELRESPDFQQIKLLSHELENLRNANQHSAEFAKLRHELQSQIQKLADEHNANLAESKRKSIRERGTLSSTAIFSDEADIENTHGDPSKVSVGANSYIRGRLLTYGHGGRIKIGDWVYVGVRTEIWSMESIEIGNRVLISHDVNIHDGAAHSSDAAERHNHFREILTKGHPTRSEDLPGVKSSPVIINDDAWISFGVTILRGVTIGAGSVIAAGAIVTKDVPAGMLYRCDIKPIIEPLPN